MALRLLVAGVASIGVFSVFVGMVWLSLPPHRAITAQPGSHLARSLDASEPAGPTGAGSWTVTTATSAQQMLVVEVQAMHLEEAQEIARLIVGPVLTKGYREILIYVHPPGGFSDGPMRRVQWTPGGGYVESVFAPLP